MHFHQILSKCVQNLALLSRVLGL